MFRITFSDLSYLEEVRSNVKARASCFKPAAELGDSVSTERSGQNRVALQEYLGSGRVKGQDVTDRKGLRHDLEAWAVPVEAWPLDLRLQHALKSTAASTHRRLAYQLDWVPSAVEEVLGLAESKSSRTFPMTIHVIPDEGRFKVCHRPVMQMPNLDIHDRGPLDHFLAAKQREAEEDQRQLLPQALKQIKERVEHRLHLPVFHGTNTLTIHPPMVDRLREMEDRLAAVEARLDKESIFSGHTTRC